MTLDKSNIPAVREAASDLAPTSTGTVTATVDNPDTAPIDTARTTRAHAGEAIADSRNWIGYALIMMGIAAMSLGLVAAAGGFGGWVLLLFPATAALFALGIVAVLKVRARVKNARGMSLLDPAGH